MIRRSRRHLSAQALLLLFAVTHAGGCSGGSGTSSSASHSSWLEGDPLVPYAWHLGNTGQTSFSESGGTPDEDIRVAEAFALGYTGRGVRIAVSDSGLEFTHEDLAANMLSGEHRDYRVPYPFGNDPSPGETRGDHGTSVTGLIAAVGWNGLGSRGVASGAKVAGFNYIANNTVETETDQLTGDFDIFNQSWGYSQGKFNENAPRYYITARETYALQIRYNVNRQRNGKGSLYARSMGNSFRDAIRDGHIVSRPGNGDSQVSLPYHVMVGAINSDGVKSSYSTAGSNIWISSPGGEYGTDSPAMITPDQSSCDVGYSRFDSPQNDFQKGHLELNKDCNYTSIFNGTSSAAPVASGVIALILEANPNLTWRDVKYILAKTSTQVDTNFQPMTHPLDPVGHINELGWITNAAGHKFHNWYGFGRINAEAAVKMARTYVSRLKTWRETSAELTGLTLPIPDFDKDGVESEITVTEDLKIEAVQITVNITHPFTGDLGIELTSPSGTKSVMMHTNNSFNQPDFNDTVLLSNAFLDELSLGKWKLRVIDGRATETGTLTSWEITVYGH